MMLRWLTRLVISGICMGFGASACYLLAQKNDAISGPVKRAEFLTATQAPVQSTQAAQQNAVTGSIRFVPATPAHASINVETLVLRESSDVNSRVVAKVKIDGSYYIDILDATQEALHVNLHLNSRSGGDSAARSEKESVYIGWTDWASVEPNTSMVVLDAGTGAVISRHPLGSMWSPVTYSPDGSRAVFNGPDTSYAKCEVRASDYSVIRCIDTEASSSFFYGPSDGALYAAIQTIGGRFAGDVATRLQIVRIGDKGASNVAADVPDDAGDFAVSPDGLTGFYLHHEDYRKQEMKVDVVDLATFKIRNSFTLHGDNLALTKTGFAVNQDGSELYASLNSGVGKVSVIDTRTGEIKRTLTFKHFRQESWYVSGGDVVGDSLLLNIGRGGHDNPHPTSRNIWLRSDGRVAVEKRFNAVFQAGNFRYALDTKGMRLFKLDPDNNVRESFKIDLSALKKGSAVDLSIYRMSASPDGKRIILFVGENG